MLLEHNSACVIQHNYRTHRFLMRFLKKAHARKMQWMREAEVSERSERALKKDEHTSHYKTLTHSLGFIKNAQNIASHLLRSAQRLAAEKLMEEQTAMAEVAARRAAEVSERSERALKKDAHTSEP